MGLSMQQQMFVEERAGKAQPIFSEAHILVTPTVVRVGDVSYQIYNIGSVQISRRSLQLPISRPQAFVYAAVLFVSGPALILFGHIIFGLIALTLGLLSLYVAMFYVTPYGEFTVTLKTSSGDTETITTEDAEFALRLKGAIEAAFVQRREVLAPPIDPSGPHLWRGACTCARRARTSRFSHESTARNARADAAV